MSTPEPSTQNPAPAAIAASTRRDSGFCTFRVAHTSCANFAEAVRRAAELADAGEHVLLSPGFASFDMFRNYEDRGDQFELLVQNLGAPAANLG